jgi:prephenate dehydrogenase
MAYAMLFCFLGFLMIQKLAIVGVGLIGGSIGLAARERKLAKEVVGVETNPHTRAEATTRRAVEKCTDMLGIGVAGADLILLASPVPTILTELARIGPSVQPKTIVSDVGSVKAVIATAGKPLGPNFIPGHPMAGSETAGIQNARADLFVGATWVLTPDSNTPPESIAKLSEFITGLGASVILMTPEAHDQAVAVTSHLPHLLAYALSSTARASSISSSLEGPSFQSATRVAASSPEMWRDICQLNRKAIADALDLCIGELDAMLKALDSGDSEALGALLKKGHR